MQNVDSQERRCELGQVQPKNSTRQREASMSFRKMEITLALQTWRVEGKEFTLEKLLINYGEDIEKLGGDISFSATYHSREQHYLASYSTMPISFYELPTAGLS